MLFDGFFEFFEYGIEIGEDDIVVGTFLQYVMQKTDAQNEFFGMFVGDIALGGNLFGHSAEVVMAAKVETHDIFDFTINHFRYIEMVGTFFFVVTFTVHSSVH